MVGESQAGKSTIVDISRRILEESGDVRYFSIDNMEEFTLKDPNIEKESGGERKALRKSLLRQIVDESSANQEITSIIKVDEIDKLKFSQELNSLFTRKIIQVGGKDLNIGNLVIMGTSNISRMMLDNFVSRSGIPLVFTKSLSRVEYSGQNFDVRNIYLLHSAVERTLGSSKKADEVISAIISDPGLSGKIADVEFYEFARSAKKLEKYIRSAGAGAQTSEYVSAAASYIDSIGMRNAEMEKLKKGDSIG
ncbi:MAG: ATP-binding protein [Candidatus Micrarchaeota archaeon]|nr:ATP-binding protein [Candidatus Micrarchaeota archaeon]